MQRFLSLRNARTTPMDRARPDEACLNLCFP